MGDFLRELYVLRDVDGLYGTISRGLGDFLAGENVFIGEHDMERTLVTGCAARHVFETPDFITVVNQCAGEHPLWEPIRRGGQEVRVLSEFASRRHWENTRLYKEALGLEGVRDHISVEFGHRKRRLTSIGVFRDRRGFSEADRAVMAFLMPHFEQALGNARLAEAGGLVGATDAARHVRLLLLDQTGCPVDMSPALQAWLKPFSSGRLPSRWGLPARVIDWLTGARSILDRGGLPQQLRPLRMAGPGGSVEFRLARRRFAPGYVLLMEARALGPADRAVLTPREREVLRWVREGKTNDEIALILSCGVTSVKTHLKNLFRKLGVDNRTAAARMSEL